MADVSIGNIYSTKVPGYEDAADIQSALRTYHYGSSTYDETNANTAALVNPSIAYHLKNIQDSVDALEALGTGSVVSNTQPTTVQEGLLWLDIDSTPGTTPVNPTAIYTAIEPSTPTDGTLWCVKGSSPLLLKIYNSATSDWDTIGE
ncbi:hypothetical protein UFOVP828_53 [uncultured Caudovirales phage]|uniref:Uncharacterized protein n=1 Tax=uncultured Caudovirales phage TaxID=2100421 RepID=A0A6J5NZY2_9CAUD|nr:hypothetical protein UFOVP828_53 [uncultured Caudovirales phage]